jgi:hypothetical protein
MYYPKSQIKTNLYTNGEEFVFLSNNQPYTGYYYKISTGKYFSGRTPDDKPNFELIVPQAAPFTPETPSSIPTTYSVLTNTLNPTNSEYNRLNPSPEILITPSYSSPTPTEQDYQIGEFRRYFCKKANEILYLEIDKNTYDKLVVKDSQYTWQLYIPFNLSWQITGDQEQVARTNKNIVELTSVRLRLPQLGRYLKDDYLKYYK